MKKESDSLGSITTNKASGGDGIPVELFQILKHGPVKCCTQYASKFGRLSSGHTTGKGQFSLQSQRKAMPNNAQTTTQLHSSSTLAKYCSKFSKPGFNTTWTVYFQKFKSDLEKAEEPEIKLPKFDGSSKSEWVPEKYLLLLYGLCQSLWLCGPQQTVEHYSRDGNTRSPYLVLEKPNLFVGQETTVKTKYGTTWHGTNRLVPNRERSTSRLYIVTLLI